MQLPPELLRRSPEETTRKLCLGLLAEAAKGLARMGEGDDDEALHDFRVALRRLRSILRAYRPALAGTGARKLAARVKKIASSTNAARDHEVQIEWLAAEGDGFAEPAASGARYLLDELRSRQRDAPTAEALGPAFRRLVERCEAAFATIPLRAGAEGSRTYVNATADVLREHADALAAILDQFESAEQAELLHDGRIEAKRLRYVLEPLVGGFPEIRPLIRSMKGLQDVLGELQDTRVLTESLSAALETSAIEDARRLREIALSEGELPETYVSRNAGLLELLKIQRARRDRCFAELDQTWRGAEGEAFFRELGERITSLSTWPEAGATERRFLLSALPEALRDGPATLVQDGWLPGAAIRECVSSTRTGRTTRFSRAVTQADGSVVEEKLTRPVFEQFWPLTEGRRLETHRYEVEGWTVVEVPARGLVLATTLAPPDASVPEALAPVLGREVTGVKKYALAEIAKSRG